MPQTLVAASAQEVADLRRRVDALDSEVTLLKRKLGEKEPRRTKMWWQELAGKFDDDPVFAEVVKEGRKWRQSQQAKARTSRARS